MTRLVELLWVIEANNRSNKMNIQFPESSEQRKAGMAMLRARMLAAHQRQIKVAKKPNDICTQQQMIDCIKAAQLAKGEA